MNNQFSIEVLKKRLTGKNPGEILKSLPDIYDSNEIAFATSLGAEDQVITHCLAETGRNVRIFMLDTGRLHEETYELLERTRNTYGVRIDVYFPDQKLVEDMVAERGRNLFYNSLDDRKRCCFVRKLEPLKRALTGAKVWISGIRRDQALTRADVELIEADAANGLIKINPLYDWSDQQIWEFIRNNSVPYNPLHDKGFPSIGCAPCTRAIKAGEDIRAGRWWWENPKHKECGLHKRGV